jgi:hypothetical protein
MTSVGSVIWLACTPCSTLYQSHNLTTDKTVVSVHQLPLTPSHTRNNQCILIPPRIVTGFDVRVVSNGGTKHTRWGRAARRLLPRVHSFPNPWTRQVKPLKREIHLNYN